MAAHLSSTLSLRRPAAVRARAAAGSSVRVAAALRSVSLKLLAASGASAMVTSTESIGGTSPWLTNRELRNLARGRRCAANLRQRCADQRTMNGSFLVLAVVGISGVIDFVRNLRLGGLELF